MLSSVRHTLNDKYCECDITIKLVELKNVLISLDREGS